MSSGFNCGGEAATSPAANGCGVITGRLVAPDDEVLTRNGTPSAVHAAAPATSNFKDDLFRHRDMVTFPSSFVCCFPRSDRLHNGLPFGSAPPAPKKGPCSGPFQRRGMMAGAQRDNNQVQRMFAECSRRKNRIVGQRSLFRLLAGRLSNTLGRCVRVVLLGAMEPRRSVSTCSGTT